jgi:hypothetical protein
MTESTLQRQILDALKRCYGWAAWARNNTGRRGGVGFGLGKGSTDLVGCVNGRMVCLEVKTPSGKVEPHQTAWMLRWSAAGAFCSVVRSVEDALSCVREVLDEQEGRACTSTRNS